MKVKFFQLAFSPPRHRRKIKLKNKFYLFSAWQEAVYLSVTVIITFLLFYSILNHYMIISDAIWLKDGVTFQWKNFFKMNSHSVLRPMVVVYFYFAYKFFGMHLSFYYACNIALHAANAVMLYFITKEQCKTFLRYYREAAFLSAMMFAVLFSHYQALVVLCNIHDTILAFFSLLSLACLLRHDRKPGLLFYWLSVLFYIFAQLSKEPAISYPFVLFAAVVLFHKPFEWKANIKKSARLLLSHFIVLAAYLLYYAGAILPAQNKDFSRFVIGTPLDFLSLNLDSLLDMVISPFTVIRDSYFTYYVSLFPQLHLLLHATRLLLFPAVTAMVLFFVLRMRRVPAEACRLSAFCVLWMVFNFVPSTVSVEAAWKNVVFFPRFRYFYLPSAGLTFMLAVIVALIYEAAEKMRAGYLRVVIFVFISAFLTGNFISTHAMIQGYGIVKQNYKNLVEDIGAACHGNCSRKFVFLVNFPEGYENFYYVGLEPSIFLFFHGAEKVLWAQAGELRKVMAREKADARKSIFVEFDPGDKSLRDSTEKYRMLLMK